MNEAAGALMRAWREDLQLPQWRAAELLEISQSSYSDYENDKKMPGADVALRIEKRTGGRVPIAAWARKHRPNGSARAGTREKRMRSRARAG